MATLIGSLTVVLTAVMALSSTAVAWNIPGHMLSATIAYQMSRAQRNRILSWTWSAGVAQVPPDSISRFCVGAAGVISVQLNWTRNPIFRGW
jgi:hypothetical protein